VSRICAHVLIATHVAGRELLRRIQDVDHQQKARRGNRDRRKYSVTVVKIGKGRVRLGINAPSAVRVHRRETVAELEEAGCLEAADGAVFSSDGRAVDHHQAVEPWQTATKPGRTGLDPPARKVVNDGTPRAPRACR